MTDEKEKPAPTDSASRVEETESRYVPAPTVSAELLPRYSLVLKAITGELSVAEAARQAGIARNRFQSLMHRAQGSFIAALEPCPAGRPAAPPEQKSLSAELRRVTRERDAAIDREKRLETQLEQVTNLVFARSVEHYHPRSTKKIRKRPAGGSGDDGESPGSVALHALELARHRGRAKLAAALAGRSAATLRRWEHRRREGRPILERRGPSPSASSVPTEAAAAAERLVRAFEGIIGADALSRSVDGLSRRQAAAVKARTVTAMERERKAAAKRVEVMAPGVLRGFDAMYVHTTDGHHLVLAAGDGAVPYTTSLAAVPRYDGHHVAAALEQDFRENGAPLVLRLDRARCHDTPEVRDVLRRHGVLRLRGPPRHPRFYGQLERENRTRRAWLDARPCPTPTTLASDAEHLRVLLNSKMRRRKLGWSTAEELWCMRPQINVDREELAERVASLTASFLREGGPRLRRDRAERRAIEQALIERGLLRLGPRGDC